MRTNRRGGHTRRRSGPVGAAAAWLVLAVQAWPGNAQEPVRSWRHVTPSAETDLAWSPPLLGFGFSRDSAVDDDGTIFTLSRGILGATGWSRIDSWEAEGATVAYFTPGRFGAAMTLHDGAVGFESERSYQLLETNLGTRTVRHDLGRDGARFAVIGPSLETRIGGGTYVADAVLLSFAASGRRDWRRTFAGASDESQDIWFDGLLGPENELYATGSTWTATGTDTMLTRVAADGGEEWFRVLPSTGLSGSYSIVRTPQGRTDSLLCAAGLFELYSERAFCVDPESASTVWENSIPIPFDSPLPLGSQVAVDGDHLVHLLSTRDGIFISMRSSETGYVRWSLSRERYLGSFVIDPVGRLVIASTSPEGCIVVESLSSEGTTLDTQEACAEEGVLGARRLHRTPAGALRLSAQSAASFDDLLVTLRSGENSDRGLPGRSNRSLLIELDEAGRPTSIKQPPVVSGSASCSRLLPCLALAGETIWSGTAWSLDGERAVIGAERVSATGTTATIRPDLDRPDYQWLRGLVGGPGGRMTMLVYSGSRSSDSADFGVIQFDELGQELWRDIGEASDWRSALWTPSGELYLSSFSVTEKRRSDGSVLWTAPHGGLSALHSDESVSVSTSGSTGQRITRLRAEDGEVRWTAEISDLAWWPSGQSQLTQIGNDSLLWTTARSFVGTAAEQIAFVQGQDGSEKWRATFGARTNPNEFSTVWSVAPDASSSTLVLLGSAGPPHALLPTLELREASSGSLIWGRTLPLPPVDAGRGQSQSGVILDGALDPERGVLWLVGQRTANGTPHDDGFVARVDAKTGDLLWLEIVAGAAGMDDALTEIVVDPATGAAIATGYEGQTNNFPQQITMRWELPGAARLEAEKTASGSFTPGGRVRYRIIVRNPALEPTGDVADGNGPEVVDQLPPELELIEATATSGTVDVDVAAHRVEWNGALAAGEEVWITIDARIRGDVAIGTMISNQAQLAYDTNGDGTNDGAALSMDPESGGVTTLGVVTPIPMGGTRIWLISALAIAGALFLRQTRE